MLKKKYKTGIDILKIWMCFEVVVCHYRDYGDSTADSLNLLSRIVFDYRLLAAPIFMLLSFYLADVQLLSQVGSKFRRRLKKLEGPNIFWALIYFSFFIIWDYIHSTNNLNGIMDFVWQVLFGHCYNRTLWFQIDLIIITISICLIYKICGKKYSNKIMCVCLILCIMIQYTGIHTILYGLDYPETVLGGVFKAEYVCITVGRIIEMIPYAIIGIYLKEIDDSRLKKNKLWILLVSCILIVFLLRYQIFCETVGFSYQGLDKICLVLLTVVVFLSIGFENIPERVREILRWMSVQTMSVYFMHRLIGYILYESGIADSVRMNKGSIGDCIIIFALCMVISGILRCIPVRFLKEFVF